MNYIKNKAAGLQREKLRCIINIVFLCAELVRIDSEVLIL